MFSHFLFFCLFTKVGRFLVYQSWWFFGLPKLVGFWYTKVGCWISNPSFGFHLGGVAVLLSFMGKWCTNAGTAHKQKIQIWIAFTMSALGFWSPPHPWVFPHPHVKHVIFFYIYHCYHKSDIFGEIKYGYIICDQESPWGVWGWVWKITTGGEDFHCRGVFQWLRLYQRYYSVRRWIILIRHWITPPFSI